MSKQHDRLKRINVKNNGLQIAGQPVEQLSAISGRTPFYVYDRSELIQRVDQLRSIMPDQLKLHYAIKANPMPAVVQHMAGLVDGLDVASHKEILVALATGTSPKHISFAGPAKQLNELKSAVAAGITINVESELELQRLYQISAELQIKARVALRVNPDFELKSSGMKMAGGPKQFGIGAEQMPDVLQNMDLTNIDFQGFHIFSGSQNLKAEALIEAHTKTFELASRLCDLAPSSVQHVNIGGGLGIPYFPGEESLDVTSVANNLQQLLLSRTGTLREAEIVMELGRYLVGEAGYYICRVTDKKISRGKTYLMTDGGLHHHLANSGNFGQVIRKNYPVLIANCVESDDTENVEIVGPLCTPLDIVGARLDLPRADVGDYIVVFQSGAYGATASPQDFLGHPHVGELLV